MPEMTTSAWGMLSGKCSAEALMTCSLSSLMLLSLSQNALLISNAYRVASLCMRLSSSVVKQPVPGPSSIMVRVLSKSMGVRSLVTRCVELGVMLPISLMFLRNWAKKSRLALSSKNKTVFIRISKKKEENCYFLYALMLSVISFFATSTPSQPLTSTVLPSSSL